MMNLSSIIETHAKFRANKEAIVMGGMRLNYKQLNDMACQVANGLKARGIVPGDKVALSCPNLPYFPVVYYGILKTGAVVVPLNVLLKPREIAYHLKDSDAKAYFAYEGTTELPIGQMAHEAVKETPGCEHLYILTATPGGPSPIAGVDPISALIFGQPTTADTVQRSADDTAVILYTSGTTGQPKGAELTHINMLMNAIISRDLHGLTGLADPKCLIMLPLFHSFGQTCQMNAMLYFGGCCVLVPRFDPKAVIELLATEKVSVFSGVPTMFWGLLNYAKQTDFNLASLTSLRLCSSGGSAMPVEILNELDKAMPQVTILEGFGLSETAPVASFNQLDFPRKVGSVGRPIQGVDMKIVDDNDVELKPGELGEIVIRGHNVMKGYYKKPEATAIAMKNGWFHSGDLGKMDDDGYFFVLDRKKDMVIRGGFNVYPREIEEVMATHPAVSLVAVVGVPHIEHGEEVKAYVILKPGAVVTERDLIDWCRENMAAYKYPRMIEFRDKLPMTATGKILKRELRG